MSHFLALLFIKPCEGSCPDDVNLCFSAQYSRSCSVEGSRDQRLKCATVSCVCVYHSPWLTKHSFFPRRLVTVNSLCLCHYNGKSWHSMVLLERGISAESWHKTMSKLRQIRALLFPQLRVCAVFVISRRHPKATDWCLHTCMQITLLCNYTALAPHKAPGTAGD